MPDLTDQRERAQDSDLWRQQRRRSIVTTSMIVLTLLGLLFWLLMHPSGPASPARKVKNLVFGPRVTDAAEAVAGGGSGSGSGSGSGQVDGQTGDGTAANGTTGAGNSEGDSGQAHGSSTSGGLGGPANPHLPTNSPGELPTPAPRSIGWLDKFFGTQPPRDNAPTRPGEGGTGEHLPGSGNTNTSSPALSNAPVAAEFTESNAAPAESGVEMPPPPARSTNRAAAANNTINDNFEQLLRQHRAGSGDVRISLMWSNKNDIDLHVVDPNVEEIFYAHRASHSGGMLDIDMNAGFPLRVPAVENVFWPTRAAPPGTYRVYVNHYRRNDAQDLTPFTVRILIRGRTFDVHGALQFGEPKKLVHQFTLGAREGRDGPLAD